MKRLFCHTATFARIEAALKAYQGRLLPILMNDAGEVSMPWGGEAGDPVAFDMVYGNTDVWYSKAVQDFMVTVLKTPKLDWFQSSAAGIEHPALQMIGQKARTYTTNHTQAEAMSEWALWMALDFFRDGPQRRADMAAKTYEKRKSRELNGSHWLIIGFGAIGAAVGRRVKALGGHVTGLRRSGGTSPDADQIIGPEQMLGALGEADVVLLSAPHTPETEGMVDRVFLAAMQREALLMNLGRGALVDEEALIEALDEGRPAFAALDVQAEEPLPKKSPLWTHSKIMLTPHDSADTEGSKQRADQTFLANLERYMAGEVLENVAPAEAFE